MRALRHLLAGWIGLVLCTAVTGAVGGNEFALLTTRSGTVQFGTVVAESSDKITLRNLKTQQDTEFAKDDLLSSKRNLDESEAFAREELPYVLAWRLNKTPLLNADGSARRGKLAIVPFAMEARVSAEQLAVLEANLATVLAQRGIDVIGSTAAAKALSSSANTDGSLASQVGKTLNADWVLEGRVVAEGEARKLHYRVLDVKSDATIVAGTKPMLLETPAAVSTAVPQDKLAGRWQIHTSNRQIAVTIIPIAGNRYNLQSSGGSVYGGEYQLRRNTLVMVKPASDSYKQAAAEMMVWQMRKDGTLVLMNTKWAGYYLQRDESDVTQQGADGTAQRK